MDIIEELFVELGSMIKSCRKIDEGYNIFRVLEVDNKEVILCRFLADLLNPEGSHQQGIKYLRTFIEEILHISFSDKQYAGFQVYKEYPIHNNRRIDIVIQSNVCFIPIEVKIHAGEQKSQCYDYYQYASTRDKNTKVIYLTMWGNLPSEFSLKSSNGDDRLPRDKVLCVSFAKDICDWLGKVLQKESGIMELLIKQYLEVIYHLTQNVRGELKVKLADKILENEEYFRTALEVEASMKTAKARLIHRVLQEFEKQMEPLVIELGLEKERRFFWYEYEEQATEDFYNCYSTYPGINYVVKRAALPGDMELWFRIEVEHNLFAGLCVFDINTESEKEVGCQADEVNEQMEAEILKYLNLQDIKKGSWWLTWWYLPTGTDKHQVNAKSVPNFKEMNEAAVKLVEENNLQTFVQGSIDVIRSMLRQLLK